MASEREPAGPSVASGSPEATSAAGSGHEKDIFRPGDRRCTFEGCARDAAILCSDDGWIALCPEHGAEFEVLRRRFREAPTQERWRAFEKVWIAAQGGAGPAAQRMKGYAVRKRLLGHG